MLSINTSRMISKLLINALKPGATLVNQASLPKQMPIMIISYIHANPLLC